MPSKGQLVVVAAEGLRVKDEGTRTSVCILPNFLQPFVTVEILLYIEDSKALANSFLYALYSSPRHWLIKEPLCLRRRILRLLLATAGVSRLGALLLLKEAVQYRLLQLHL